MGARARAASEAIQMNRRHRWTIGFIILALVALLMLTIERLVLRPELQPQNSDLRESHDRGPGATSIAEREHAAVTGRWLLVLDPWGRPVEGVVLSEREHEVVATLASDTAGLLYVELLPATVRLSHGFWGVLERPSEALATANGALVAQYEASGGLDGVIEWTGGDLLDEPWFLNLEPMGFVPPKGFQPQIRSESVARSEAPSLTMRQPVAIDGLAPGHYLVVARSSQREASQSVQVPTNWDRPRFKLDLDLGNPLSPLTIRGAVTVDGVPVVSGKVYYTIQGDVLRKRNSSGTFQTDSSGRYEISSTHLVPGVSSLTFAMVGYEDVSMTLEPVDVLDVAFHSEGIAEWIACDRHGSPLAQVSLHLGGSPARLRTEPDGRVALPSALPVQLTAKIPCWEDPVGSPRTAGRLAAMIGSDRASRTVTFDVRERGALLEAPVAVPGTRAALIHWPPGAGASPVWVTPFFRECMYFVGLPSTGHVGLLMQSGQGRGLHARLLRVDEGTSRLACTAQDEVRWHDLLVLDAQGQPTTIGTCLVSRLWGQENVGGESSRAIESWIWRPDPARPGCYSIAGIAGLRAKVMGLGGRADIEVPAEPPGSEEIQIHLDPQGCWFGTVHANGGAIGGLPMELETSPGRYETQVSQDGGFCFQDVADGVSRGLISLVVGGRRFPLGEVERAASGNVGKLVVPADMLAEIRSARLLHSSR